MSDLNEKLAALKGNYLERDDETDPGGRIYRDKVSGEIYHSVTRILGATAPEEQQKALAKWLERPDSGQTRDMAAARGTARWPQPAHSATALAGRMPQSQPQPQPQRSGVASAVGGKTLLAGCRL